MFALRASGHLTTYAVKTHALFSLGMINKLIDLRKSVRGINANAAFILNQC